MSAAPRVAAFRRASRSFQVFAKPAGAACNLACDYCYYLRRGGAGGPGRMPDDLLEAYIVQHIRACPDEIVRFSWHGGEPTVLGLDYFRRVADLQRKHRPPGRTIANGLQTNGVLIDDDWGGFLAGEGFAVGLSLDGPRGIHDLHRRAPGGGPSFDAALRAWEVLGRHGVSRDVLCVVGAESARRPDEVYGFFKSIGATFVSFLPLVEPSPGEPGGSSRRSVPAEAWGAFLCRIFDEWVERDIGRIKVQIFEEAARTAFGQEHSLCLFRPECGDVPVLERDGTVYPCDHFADPAYRLGNIRETPLVEILDGPARRDFGRRKAALPRICRACEVLEMCRGECPKNRLAVSPDGEAGWNVLCRGYRAFFNRCRPFVEAVAAEWRREGTTGGRPPGRAAVPPPSPGRNDPCPCGSGRKFKTCCGAP